MLAVVVVVALAGGGNFPYRTNHRLSARFPSCMLIWGVPIGQWGLFVSHHPPTFIVLPSTPISRVL